MNFLNSGLLAILAPLLALPLLIHLFNRHFPYTIKFPDLERIRKSLTERSKMARWRHLLMTLLRTLAVLLALLAFLKPVLPRFGSDAEGRRLEGRRVLLVLDRSFSLEHQEGAATSAARNALVEAGKILATLGSGDSANAILAGTSAGLLLPEFTTGHDQIRVALSALPTGFERADPGKAIALAATALGKESKGAEIYFLSDFQRSNWADVSFDLLPERVRLFFVNVSGSDGRHNTAILSVGTATNLVSVHERVTLEVSAGNWTPDPVTLPLEAIIDGRSSFSGEIALEPWSTGRGTIEIEAPGEGLHWIEVRTPDDALPADNRRYLKLEVRQREEILIVSDADAAESGVLFASTALNPFDDQGGAYAPRVLPLGELTPGSLASTSKLILTGTGNIAPDLAGRLIGFLEAGGGMIYFLDGPSDGENLLALDAAAGRSVSPFLVSGKLTTENFGGSPQKIAKGEFQSRYLRLFRGENRQALGLLEFYEVRRALPTGEGKILLHFADGTPALGVSEVGLGSAIFCNFSPVELSSNLARQRLFPAWMQELVKNLTPESSPADSREIGATLLVNLWQRDFDYHGLRGPRGEPVSTRTSPEGERINVSFEAATPGVYTAGPPEAPLWIEAANISAEESDLRRIDPEELTNRASDAPVGPAHFVEGAEDYEELTKGRPIFHWFLLGLALVLIVEMLLYRPIQRASGQT